MPVVSQRNSVCQPSDFLKENKHGCYTITAYSSSNAGWSQANKKLMKIVDNGNGFTITAYSWSSCEQNIKYSLPYDTAGYIMDMLKLFDFMEEPE